MQLSSIKKRFDTVKYDVLVWESDKTNMIWDADPVKASKYLKDIGEIRFVIENLKKLQWARKEWQADELLCHVDNILQTALGRLEEEFIHQLVQRCRHSEPDPKFFKSLEKNQVHEFSSSSFSEDSFKWRSSRCKSGNYSFEESIVSFFDIDTVQKIRDIAEAMFASGLRRNAVKPTLGVEKMYLTIGIPSPERLFCVLDMYIQLTNLLPEIKELFAEKETGSYIVGECHELLQAMVEYIKGALCEFESSIQNDLSNVKSVGGGIHHLTKYVMNYLGNLVDYKETLDLILVDVYKNNVAFASDDDCEKKSFLINISPVAWISQLITAILVSNLSTKSMLYEEESLQHLFMMNNINCMVKMVNGTLLKLVGNEWMRTHTALYRKHAVYFERTSWNSILGYLTVEGVQYLSSTSSLATIVKQKLKNLNQDFEKIYSTQTAWQIPDEQLREEMRISISVKLLQAYRSFVGMYGNRLESERQRRKYIKFCIEDLQNYLLDLFEGKVQVFAEEITLRRS